ncbi:hypothetical protein BD410DRAFT_900946 [Rickenella mellea]|uniref:Zn(2)-C6 fungal-type domain-containing protein n=1 Tax=Rickenella mellea TaxID=50990 RepID=A0A4Y7PTH4_9AGAM|nr:hypothetical protein BD410DRAFT_900946 [Rickenella mellea]
MVHCGQPTVTTNILGRCRRLARPMAMTWSQGRCHRGYLHIHSFQVSLNDTIHSIPGYAKMPAEYRSDTSKRERATRRVGYSVELKQIDQELKRSRGEIACAECNRLKVKCDKKIPCSSCVRRGFSDLCPNNSLADVRDTRQPATDTERLKVKVMEMSERIRQLEDALEIATANMPARHPLLREELLAVKRGFGVQETVNTPVKQENDLSDDFGTLTISDDGSSRFMGRTAGAESLMMTDLLVGPDVRISSEFSLISPTVASQGLSDPGDIRRVEGAMPPFERATSLCETYLQQASWIFQLVRRPQLIDELLIPIYKRVESDALRSSNIDDDVKHRHGLALLLAVFAMGALNDLTLPPYNEEAHGYYFLARTLINSESAADCPSLTAVQALGTMCTYHALSDRTQSLERPIAMSNYVQVLAAAIGLHRDPARWKLDEKTVQRRRDVFWQLFMMSNWQGLKNGRPMLFTLPFLDTELPDDFEQVSAVGGTVQMGGWRWLFRFAKEILYEINILSNSVGAVKYSDIIELDQKLREFSIPQNLQIPPEGSSWDNDGPYIVMQRFLVTAWRNIAFIDIHRNYFAKAILECPNDPLSSQYASSFLATYRASMAVIRSVREHFNMCPDYWVRVFIIWSYMFSSMIVVGTVVIRGPTSSLAPAAMIELTLGVRLFEKAAAANAQWAKRALAVLTSIRDKALASYSKHRNGQPVVDKAVTQGSPRTWWVAELDIFGGSSVAVKKAGGLPSGSVTYLSSSTSSPSPSSSPSPPAVHSNSKNVSTSMPESHPEQFATASYSVDKSYPQTPIPSVVSEEDLAAFLDAVSQSNSTDLLFPADPMNQSQAQEAATLSPPQGTSNSSSQYMDNPVMTYPCHDQHENELSWAIAADLDALGVSSMDVAMDESWSTFLQDSGFIINQSDPFNSTSFT